MRSDDSGDDSLIQTIAYLPRVEPDAARAARIRTACHTALGGQAVPLERARTRPVRTIRTSLERAAFASVCLLYLFDVLRRALSLSGI